MSNSDNKLYFYENSVDVVFTTDQFYVDNRTMDTRHLKAHKGVTNDIIFTVRNRDRKLQNVTSSTVHAHIVDPSTRKQVVSKILDNTNDVGKLKLTIYAGDIQQLIPGLYKMYITHSSDETSDRPLYTDQNNNMSFNIDITDQVAATPIATQTQSTFLQTADTNTGADANVFVTDALYGNLDQNFPDALHTMAVYLEGYTGTVTIQASCLTTTPDTEHQSTDWFDVDAVEFTEADSNIYVSNFNVNCNWVRLITEPLTGEVAQVLLRN